MKFLISKIFKVTLCSVTLTYYLTLCMDVTTDSYRGITDVLWYDNSSMPTKQQSAREATIQTLLANHDPKISPDFEEDFPTIITVQLYVVSIDSLNEAAMDYSMSIFLRQSWSDRRLEYEKLPGVDMLELDTRVMDEVWVPDLYFTNEKQAGFHDVTVPNKLMHIYPNGSVLYSARISMTLSCDMYLQKFPFDSQTCYIAMESYSYSVKNVVFVWPETAVILRENLKLPQFELIDWTNIDCTKEYKGTGNYTCIRVEFHLDRNYGYYVAQVYIPSVLIVSLSWVSFWLDIDAVPARISLGLLTVLTMTTQSANARAHLPRVSYIKAIDVWMAMCLFFVFAALIEFAYVNVNARVEKRRSGQTQATQGGLKLNVNQGSENGKTEDTDDDNESKPKRLFSKTTIGRAKARRLDKISRYTFPGIFIGFNLFYWLFYMFWKPRHDNGNY